MGGCTVCRVVLSRAGGRGECGGGDRASPAEYIAGFWLGAGDVDRALYAGFYFFCRGGGVGGHRLSFTGGCRLGFSFAACLIKDHGDGGLGLSSPYHDRTYGVGCFLS